MAHLVSFWHLMVWLGIVIQFLGLLCFLGFYFKKKPVPLRGDLKNLPGLTLIKPCYTKDDSEDKIFDAYFKQEYAGPFELIFVVSEPTDPVVPVVQDYLKKYPHIDAKLMISKTRKAYWKKIDAYFDAYKASRYDHIVITDSDTIVRSDYVSQMIAALSEPGISVVTVPQYDTGVNNFATALKTLGNNCDVAVYVMLMNFLVRKKKVGWGHSVGFRKSEFDQFGEDAWDKLRNCFGDDLVLPTIYTQNGKKVVYRNIYCPVQFSNKTFSQMMDQQKRFALCQKAALGPLGYVSGLLLFPLVTASFYVLFSGFSVESLELFVLVWATRAFVSLIFEGLIFGSVKTTLLYFWTIPLWDLLKIYFSFHVLGRSHVQYHGRTYRISENARLVEMTSDES